MAGNAMGYKQIMDQAFTNMGLITAQADEDRRFLDQQRLRYMSDSKKGRAKSHKNNREGASSRGLLQSSNSLDEIKETNTNFDNDRVDYDNQYNYQLGSIGNKVTGAKTAYDNSQENYRLAVAQDQAEAAELKRIADENKMALTPPTPAPVPAADPYNTTSDADPHNWGGIAAMIRDGVIPDPNAQQPTRQALAAPTNIVRRKPVAPISRTPAPAIRRSGGGAW